MDPSKEYLEGEMCAMEEDAHITRPSPFSNPYDPWFPMRAAEWERGYKTAKGNLRKPLTSPKAG